MRLSFSSHPHESDVKWYFIFINFFSFTVGEYECICLHVWGPMNELPIAYFFPIGLSVYKRFLYSVEINMHVIVYIFLHFIVWVFTLTFLIFKFLCMGHFCFLRIR